MRWRVGGGGGGNYEKFGSFGLGWFGLGFLSF